MATPNSREQLADLWRRYKLALERLDWALNELAKTPQVKEEPPPPPQIESRRDSDPPPINPRPKPADDEGQRHDAHEEVHCQKQILLRQLCLVGIRNEEHRQVPQRPEHAEDRRRPKVTAIRVQTIDGIASRT